MDVFTRIRAREAASPDKLHRGILTDIASRLFNSFLHAPRPLSPYLPRLFFFFFPRPQSRATAFSLTRWKAFTLPVPPSSLPRFLQR